MRGFFYEDKDKEAIKFIQENEPSEGYFLGFSGGKDSVVLNNLVERAGVRSESFYSSTGVDAPELVKLIKRSYPTVTHVYPKNNFFKLILKEGFPSRRVRWCCDKLKKEPTEDIPLPHRLLGIRADESWIRKKRGRISEIKNQIHYYPLFHWFEWEIWEYIDRCKIPYCNLYDQGFRRLGCVVCPCLSYQQHQINRERWPKHYHAFEKAMRELWNNERRCKWQKRWLSSFDEFIEWWYRGCPKFQEKEEGFFYGGREE